MNESEQTYGVEFHGQFIGEWRISVDGYRVPYVSAYLCEGTENVWNLSLDERFGITATQEEIEKWMWWILNAMAIAAGRTSFGEGARDRNIAIFDQRIMGITSVESNEVQPQDETQPFDGLDTET